MSTTSKKKTPAKKPSSKKVEILLPVAGRFKRAENVGDVVSLPIALADEMIENKYAKAVK